MATTWYQPTYVWHITTDTSTASTTGVNPPITSNVWANDGTSWPITFIRTDGRIYWGAAEPVLTEKQIEEQKKRDRERKKARKAARKLLMSILGKQQRREFSRYGRFRVYADGVWYKIAGSRISRLERWDGPEVEGYCIHAKTEVPHEDEMAMWALMLTNDVERKRLFKTAHPYKIAA